MSHQKHAHLTRPATGDFHRCELALLGAPCGVIKDLVTRLLPHLALTLRIGYVDADHATGDGAPPADSLLTLGAGAELTDKIHFRRLDSQPDITPFAQRPQLAGLSAVLVNGNHFRARQQVVIIDPRKPLDKKLDRLTDVQLVLLSEGQTALPEVLQNHLGVATGAVSILPLADTTAIAGWLLQWHAAARPSVRGLVLAGGRSQRMQTDKSRLRYHAAEQREHVAALMAPFCAEVFVSGQPDQLADLPPHLTPLPDQFLDLGPMGGLLTAFRHDPNTAWLVVACDLPFLTAASLQHLVKNRKANQLATAFRDPETGFPEPLIAIWEPRAYGPLLQFLAQGYSCPRKVLINSDTALLEPLHQQELRNVNTPAERAEAERELRAG
jgi:molybdenum cofactor guanylyltransferase